MKNKDIIHNPINPSQLKHNADMNYVSQFKGRSSRKDNNYDITLFYLTHRSNKRFVVYGFQFKKKNDKYHVVFLLSYGQRFEEQYDSNYHDEIIKRIIGFGVKNDFESTYLKTTVFKNKNFNASIHYADNIKESLFLYLAKKYPNASIIPEFKLGNTIVDMALFDNGKIFFYEIKSSQDSFTRLDKQLEDYKNVADYTFVVLDTSKLDSYNKKYKDDCIGIIEYNNGKVKSIKKSKLVKREITLYKFLWSNEIKDIVQGLAWKSKLNTRTIEIYLSYIFKNNKELNQYVIFLIQERYRDITTKFKKNPSKLSKGFIKPIISLNLEGFLKEKLNKELLESPRDFIEKSINFKSTIEKNKELVSFMKNIKSKNYYDKKFDGTFKYYRGTEFEHFIFYSREKMGFSNYLYGEDEILLFLFLLKNKRVLNKLISDFQKEN